MARMEEYPRRVRDWDQAGYVFVEDGTIVREWILETAEDVDADVLEAGWSVVEGWYLDSPIDWEELLKRTESYLEGEGPGGSDVTFGPDADTPAIRYLKRELRERKREG